MIRELAEMLDIAESAGWAVGHGNNVIIMSRGNAAVRLYRESYGVKAVFNDLDAGRSWTDHITNEDLCQEVANIRSTIGVKNAGDKAKHSALVKKFAVGATYPVDPEEWGLAERKMKSNEVWGLRNVNHDSADSPLADARGVDREIHIGANNGQPTYQWKPNKEEYK